MAFSGIKREWTFQSGGLTAEQLAFCRRWVKQRNDSLAVMTSLISVTFHFISLFTDPHVSSPKYLPILTATHIFVISILALWAFLGQRLEVKLRHVLHGANFVAVCSYIYILYSCVATQMPQEDLLLASVAVSMLSVYATLLSPCSVPTIAFTAFLFWGFSSLAYGANDDGLRWIIVNVLALSSAVAFQAGRLVLAKKEGLREYERLRLLGRKAQGEVRKRKKVEIQLEETAARAVRASQMAFLTEMTGGIAHEIDNPLSALQMRAETMRERIQNEAVTNEEMIEFTRRVEAAAKRIGRIVKGIRRVARKADVDDFEEESLATIVSDVAEICQGRLKSQDVQLIVDIPAELSLHCRAAEVGQILLNLISNAVDAVEGCNQPWIQLKAYTEKDEVIITVTDSGTGIPPQVREHIFEPFYTTKERGKGNGLGLGIVKSIVDRHGGTIELDCDHPHTRFIVRLPIDGPSRALDAA